MSKPRALNFLANPDDLQVLVLAKLGQTTTSISERVKLSPSQVQYRIKHGNATWVRRDFRNGVTVEFNWCYTALRKKITESEFNRIETEVKKRQL